MLRVPFFKLEKIEKRLYQEMMVFHKKAIAAK
jgi:hypothetical protein